MKQFKKILKIVTTGAVWGYLYWKIILPVWGWFFDFDFLSLQAWASRYQDFIGYRWQIKEAYDFALLFSMILWIPIFFVGWYFLCQVNWRRFKPQMKPKAVAKKVIDLKMQENKPMYAAPRAMPSAVQPRTYKAPKLPGQEQEENTGDRQKSHQNVVQMIRQIATLAKKYQVEIFQHILLEGARVPLAVSTDARAVLIEIVNRKNVNWSVEFSEDIMESNWYSEGGVMEGMAQDLLKATASLARSEPNSQILSAIILTDGRILNPQQTMDYFKKHGIFLLAFNNGEPKSQLGNLASFLSAYFDLKDGEEDPSPVKVEKVPLPDKTSQETATDETGVVEDNTGAVEETAHLETEDQGDAEHADFSIEELEAQFLENPSTKPSNTVSEEATEG